MTLEQEIKQAENILGKLRQDIVALEARRSSLQNEVNGILEDAKEKAEQEHVIRTKRYDDYIAKKDIEIDSKQKYLDKYMMDLEKRKEDLDLKEKYLQGLEEKNKFIMDEFAEKQRRDMDNLNSLSAQLQEKSKVLEDSLKNLEKSNSALDLKEIELNTLKLSIQKATDTNLDLLRKVKDEQDKNTEILKSVSEKEASIKEESAAIKGILDDIQRQRDEIAQLSVYKDDIVKLEQLKADNLKELERIKTYSKAVEARDVAVTEKETTQSEKEKYLLLKEREVSSKIEILKKLRAGQVV